MNIEILLSGAISGIIGVLGTYVIVKKIKNDIIFDIQDQISDIPKLINDENFQKFLYMAGGMIGKGARSGIGMDKKMNMKDLALNLVGNWIQNTQQSHQTERNITPRGEKIDPFKV